MPSRRQSLRPPVGRSRRARKGRIKLSDSTDQAILVAADIEHDAVANDACAGE